MNADGLPADSTATPRRVLTISLLALVVGTAAMGAFFLITPALSGGSYYGHHPGRITNGYQDQVLMLFIPYAAALWAWWRGARTATWVLVLGAVGLHVLVAFAPPPQSQDFYQYLFYGRIQAAHGANPYLVAPVVFRADPWYPLIRWPLQTTVYGPAWTLLSFAVARVAGASVTAAAVLMKGAVLLLDMAAIAGIVLLARGRPDPEADAGRGLLMYGFNPLVVLAIMGGLSDVAIAGAVMLAMLTRRRGHAGWTTVLLALAALVKVYAAIFLLLHVALLMRERRGRALGHVAGATAVAAGVFAPFWAGWRTFRGLVEVAAQANITLTGTVEFLIERLLHTLGDGSASAHAALVRWPAFALIAAAVVWAVDRARDDESLWYAALAVLAVYLVFSPRFLSWYLIAPLAVVSVLRPNRLSVPLLAASGTSLIALAYGPWSVFRVVQTGVRYGPPLAIYARIRPRSPGMAQAPIAAREVRSPAALP